MPDAVWCGILILSTKACYENRLFIVAELASCKIPNASESVLFVCLILPLLWVIKDVHAVVTILGFVISKCNRPYMKLVPEDMLTASEGKG